MHAFSILSKEPACYDRYLSGLFTLHPRTRCCINDILFDMPLSVALHYHMHNIVSTLMAAGFARTHVRGAPVVHFLCGLRPSKHPLGIIRYVQWCTFVQLCLFSENVAQLPDEFGEFENNVN